MKLSFSIRLALVLIFLFALGCGWVANAARKQWQAIAEVTKYHGYIEYDYEAESDPNTVAKSWVPTWILRHFGPDYFHRVATVTYIDQPPSDATLLPLESLTDITNLAWTRQVAHNASPVTPPRGLETLTEKGLSRLGGLHRLRSIQVDVGKEHISDFSLKNLIGSPLLESISLSNTAISDEGLPPLQAFPHLKTLEFKSGNAITGECLATLGKMNHVEDLAIHDEPISSAGFTNIGAMTSLKDLDLSETNLNDTNLKCLAGLKHLTRLRLLGPVTDEGLAIVAGMPDLEILEVWSTNLTDAGLRSVRKLKHLETLFLNRTKVTKEAVADLQKTLPGLTNVSVP